MATKGKVAIVRLGKTSLIDDCDSHYDDVGTWSEWFEPLYIDVQLFHHSSVGRASDC